MAERIQKFTHGGVITYWIGKDGKTYSTQESALAADQAYLRATTGQSSVVSGNSVIPVNNGGGGGGGGGTSSGMTAEFLKQWGKISDATLKTLEKAIAGIEGIGDAGLSETITMLKQQAEQYAQKYGGLEQESIDATRQAIRDRLTLQGQLMKGTRANIRGVTGRAATDVQGESEAARAEMARQAMSYGVDPTSGKFGALTQKSFMDEARSKAIAMDVARRGETTRALGETKDAMQLISPTEYSNIAQGISQGEQGYYSNIGNLQSTSGQLQIAKANALGNIAGGMYNVGQDYGSAGLGMYGAQQGYSGGAFTSQNNTASDNASTVQSGAISIGRDENNDIQTTTSGGLSSLPTVSSRNEGFALG